MSLNSTAKIVELIKLKKQSKNNLMKIPGIYFVILRVMQRIDRKSVV